MSSDEEMKTLEEDDNTENNEDCQMEDNKSERKVYIPSSQGLKKGEQLEMDESAYIMYHQAQTGAPCLSFDIMRTSSGDNHTEFPFTAYIVAGTQSERSHANSVMVLKMYNMEKLKKTKDDIDEDEVSDDSDNEVEEKASLESALIHHQGSVNRIRNTKIENRHIAATWSELKKVHIWDLTDALAAVDDYHLMANFIQNNQSTRPLFTFNGHLNEGFALDWSPVVPGSLATGDCTKNIHLWKMIEGGSWFVDKNPCIGHSASVEDIQWSPNEATVFASCSVDKSIRIWDNRAAPHKACMLTADSAHDNDVNVISWNKNEPFIISGGDDGILKVWDLRQFQEGKSVGLFKHHFSPITSVEWHPTDSTVFAASGADDQLTLWDLAVEREESESADVDIPAQLLFIHQGQTDIKEVHWHPQFSGVIISTALSGFNIFKTISV